MLPDDGQAAQQLLWKHFPTAFGTARFGRYWTGAALSVLDQSRDWRRFFVLAAGINTVFFETFNAGALSTQVLLHPGAKPISKGWDPLAGGVG